MLKAPPSDCRDCRKENITADLVVVGGGLAGVCCAITAARADIKVALVQDRPVLGGNASSEVRLWVLGATSHMGNNNRWAREGGVIDEILVENMYRNPEGNPLIFDTVILEKVIEQPNIHLLLNTAVHEVQKRDADTIDSITAFCSQNSTVYQLHAPLFCDASGDGIIAFMAGAAFRMGAESKEEFGEKFAPDKEYGELLGHSIYFYSKDTGKPVQFVPPSFALSDITAIPRYRQFKLGEDGCRLWWIEYGGRLDTVHDTERIKWELWKVVYGVWNHIKNSGEFPESSTHTLEWVGTIPGKRESRRFEGDYMLIQQDVVEQRPYPDAVSFGGWSIDLHPADGVFSNKPGCNQWHAKGVYPIPYRCMYSRNISNLFLAGRIISASHVAFGSSRVMATGAHGGQAVGMAAALCLRKTLLPRDLCAAEEMATLQHELTRIGQYIPTISLNDPTDLAQSASITASSTSMLAELPTSHQTIPLTQPWAMLLPLQEGRAPRFAFIADVHRTTELHGELRISSRRDNHTPDVTLATQIIRLSPGRAQPVAFDFDARLADDRYAFVCLMTNPDVQMHLSDQRMTGVLSLTHRFNPAVAKTARQQPDTDIGVDTFEFWTPLRRPNGKNLAMVISPPLNRFAAANVANGVSRPTREPNAWVADIQEETARLTLEWDRIQTIGRVELTFDCDYDHPMESVLMGHPERIMPFCVRRYRLIDDAEQIVHEENANHQTRNVIVLLTPIRSRRLVIELDRPSQQIPAALFEVRCYAPT
jgi:FAD dependent oxidoreductase